MSAVWVPVLASMKGFIAEVEKGAGQASKSAGKHLEKGLGEAGKAGGQSAADEMAKAMQSASQKVAAARQKEAGATADLGVAEQHLENLRAEGTSTAGQIMAAEAKVEDARRTQEAMSARLGAAEQDLQAVREGGEARASSIVAAENRLEDARLKSQAAADKVKAAEQQADDARQASMAATQKAESAEVQLALAKAEHGEGSREVTKAERELEQARKQADRSAVAVAQAEGRVKKERSQSETATERAEVAELQLKAAHDKSAQSAKGAADATDDLESSLSGMEDVAGAAAAAMGGLGLAMGAEEILESAGAINMMNGQLGLTGQAAAGMADEVSSVMRSGLAGSTEEAALAVGSLSSQFGYLGFEGEQTAAELADNFLAFTSTFGVSMEEATQTAGQLIQNGLASDVEQAADLMTAAMQRVPAAMRDELPEIMNEYGTNFRALGFSGEEAFGLLVSAADKGKWALDKTGDALKEFTIRGSDMSTGSVAAFEAIGLSAEDMSAKIASGGPGAREALDQVAQGILGIEDPAERANTAIALFGTPLEDLSVDQIPQFLEGLTGAEAEMEGFADASGDLADGMRDSLQGRLNSLKGSLTDIATNGFMVAWDAVSAFIDVLGPFAPVLGSIVIGLTAGAAVLGIVAGAMKAATVATAIWNAVLAMNPMVRIIAAIVAVVAALAWFFTQTETGRAMWESFTNFLGEAWGKITAWASDAWETISSIWSGIPEWFGEKWDAVTSKVSEVWESIKTTISEKWTAITTWFSMVWEAYKAQVSANWEAVKSIFTGVWEAIWGVITGVWTRISTWITNAWNLFQAYVHLVWTAVKMIFTGQWGAIQQLITDVWTRISAWITGKWEEFKSYVAVVWRGIQNVFAEVWDSIKTKIAETWEAIKAAVAEAVANVINKMTEFVNGIRQKIDEAVGKLKDFPGQVKRLFADAGRWLINAGRNIINGLWEGMKNAWSNVKGWLSDNLSFSAIGSFIGLSGGGIVMADGGVINNYSAGGIDQIEHYANGGGRENHRAQIAPAGAWRVWAEPETGGEAYIPLASSKRGRSTAILDEVAGRFGYTLVDAAGRPYSGGYSGDLGPQHVTNFADGGVVTGEDLLSFVGGSDVGYGKPSRPLHGAPYDWAGINWGDCSGAVSAVANTAVGMRSFGSRFATANEASELSRMGFSRGRGGDGDLRIGFRNGGPAGGHTAGTLPDGTNFEMGGAANQGSVGARAAGAWDSYFNEFFHLPIGPGFEKVELDDFGDLSADPAVPEGTAGNVTVTNPDSAATASTAAATESKETTISGQIGEIGKEAITGQVSDFLGVFGIPDTIPAWMTAGRDIKEAQSAGSATTSAAEESAIAQHDAAVTTMTPSEIAQDPQLSGLDDPDVINQPEVPAWGPEFFAYEIARQAKAMGLSKDGAKIGIATALVESGDPMKMYANNRVPESLKFRHDALGSDHDSVGLFQQRDNGAWGTVAQRMNAFESAGLFFRELVKFDWESMDPGAAAQKVQRSAFPDRYATKMDRAMQMVEGTGLYDQGGILDDKHLALNLSGKPEAVLTNDQWKMVDQLGGNLPQLVGGAASSAVSGAVSSGAGALGGVANTIVPGSGAMIASAGGPIGELGGWYAGEVTSGWTSAIMQASQQAMDIAAAPLEDLGGVLSGPLAPVANSARPIIRPQGMPAQQQQGGQSDGGFPPGTVVIQVNSVDEALDAKRHLEARQLAGFGVTR